MGIFGIPTMQDIKDELDRRDWIARNCSRDRHFVGVATKTHNKVWCEVCGKHARVKMKNNKVESWDW